MNRAFKLYEEHKQAHFPASLRGTQIQGVDLVLLDGDTAGCIDSYFRKSGTQTSLSPEKQEMLSRCRTELSIVVKSLQDDSKEYFQRLLTISDTILTELQNN